MTLNDLLRGKDLDPKQILVLRHRPHEAGLRKVLPWIAGERPDLFNAYQQAQGETLEKSLEKLIGTGHVASFFGHEPGRALFVALYSIAGAARLNYEQFWKFPANAELKAFGMRGLTPEDRPTVLWFDLQPVSFYSEWKGKLVVG